MFLNNKNLMNKIVHIFTEIIDAPEPHKVMKKNSVRVTRIHNAHAECQLDTINALRIFSFPALRLVTNRSV